MILTTPLAVASPEVTLEPDDVTVAVDDVKDYTFIVTVSFDEDTPDQVRTRAQADLEEITFHLNQTRDDLTTPLPDDNFNFSLTPRTYASEGIIAPGATARFVYVLSNSGTAPITDIEVRSPYGTSPVTDHLNSGDTVRFFTEVPNTLLRTS